MLITAAILSLHLSSFRSHAKPPAPTCGISTVSYRFEGQPGTEFVYSGTRYVVPRSGWVELIAERPPANRTVAYGRELILDVWPADEFGTRHVPLPQPPADGANTTTNGGMQ